MIRPPYLKKGDRVSIVSPAKKINKEELEFAISFLESKGLVVELGKHALGDWNRFSGTDAERTFDFQEALDNPDIKAIFCARGGYGSVRIIDQLNFSHFKLRPKWIVGYSDITVFHNTLFGNEKTCSLHGPMPLNMVNKKQELISAKALTDTLFGNQTPINFSNHPLNKTGKSEGKMVGGNLAVFSSLIGTNQDVETSGCILFIEDLCEELYKIDRMMHQLKKSNKLDQLAGVLVGGFTDILDDSKWFSLDSLDIISEHISNLNIPVGFGFPAGHTPLNMPIIIGGHYELSVTAEDSRLEFKS